MTKHGILVIGCGSMASVHCAAIQATKLVRLMSAVDVHLDRAKKFQAEFGFERVGGDYRAELTRTDFDIVLAATHWPMRFQIIRDCFEAGKHVLAEKPLSVYLDEVDALTALANEKKLKLRVGLMERFRPMFLKICELLAEGVIGTPRVYSFQHHQRGWPDSLDAGWEYQKNMLRGGVTPNVDCGIHKCDLVRMFSGAEAESAISMGQKLEADSPANNFAHSVFRLTDGSSFVLEDCYSRNTEPFIHTWILGDKGRILFEYAGAHDRPILQPQEDIIHLWRRDSARHSTFYTPLTIKPVAPQLEAFIREIEEDRDMNWHYQNVRKATEMVMATVLSEHRGEIVRFPLSRADLEEIRRLIKR